MSEDLFSVLAAIGIIALVYRWFTTTPTASSTGPNPAGSLSALQRRAINLPRAQVDRLLTMFPQLTENEVRYALVVTRGGVEAVAERVLIRGGLEPPPANFFPASSTAATPAAPATNASTPSSAAARSAPSLISKLDLQAYKVDQDQAIKDHQPWSWEECRARILALRPDPSSDDPAAALGFKDRQAKMVLEARWKLLQKDRKGKSVAAN